VKLLLATPPGRALFDRMKLRLPAIGPVMRKAVVARITRTLGTLLGSGVPILAVADHRQGDRGEHAHQPRAGGRAYEREGRREQSRCRCARRAFFQRW